MEPVNVASADNPLLVRIRRLVRDPVAYRRLGQCWLAGDHLGQAALARGWTLVAAVVAESAWTRHERLARQAQRVLRVPDRLMAQIDQHESAVPIGFVIDWPASPPLQPDAATVVLDRLQDAGNVGNILRSAAAFGVRQVLALKGTAGLWSPKVLRAAMGAHFSLHLLEAQEVSALDRLSVPVLATSSHAPRTIAQAWLPSPCAWVVGHEGQGVDPALASRCQMVLRIPQPGGQESLNVASATAICLYEAWRQQLADSGAASA